MKNCNLPPFKAFVLQNFPFIEEDFDALTYYEILCKLVEQLKLTDEQVAKITEIINNFDVQEEVDKKLDEMAEDGTLEELINQEILGDLQNQVDIIETKVNKLDYYNSKFTQNILKNVHKNVVFAGDSLTRGQSSTSEEQVENPFPSIIETFVNNWYEENNLVKAKNYGVGGARSSRAITDFPSYLEENPDTIFWAYGTNDATDQTSMNQYISNLDTFYNLCVTNNIELIVIIPPPSYQSLYRRQAMKMIENSLIQYCESRGILYVNMFEYVENLYNTRTYAYYTQLQDDGTHFNNYKCYADAILSKFLPCIYNKENSQLFEYIEVAKTRNYVKSNGDVLNGQPSILRSGLRFLAENNNNFEFNFLTKDLCYIDLLGFRINYGCKATFKLDGVLYTFDEELLENTDNTDTQYNWRYTFPVHLGAGLHKIELISLTASETTTRFFLFGFLLYKNQLPSVDYTYPQRKNMINIWSGQDNEIEVDFPTNNQNLNTIINEIHLLIGTYGYGFTEITVNPVEIYKAFTEDYRCRFVVPSSGDSGELEIATFFVDTTNKKFVFSSATAELRRIDVYTNTNHLNWNPITTSTFLPIS